jgi:hypothetical protein
MQRRHLLILGAGGILLALIWELSRPTDETVRLPDWYLIREIETKALSDTNKQRWRRLADGNCIRSQYRDGVELLHKDPSARSATYRFLPKEGLEKTCIPVTFVADRVSGDFRKSFERRRGR